MKSNSKIKIKIYAMANEIFYGELKNSIESEDLTENFNSK